MGQQPNDNPSARRREASTGPVSAPGLAAADGHDTSGASAAGSFTARNPWAVFVLPYVVFIVAGAMEPAAGEAVTQFGWTFPWATYPLVYTLKIVLVMAIMTWLWRGYRQFAFRISPLALGVGAVGGLVWVGLCQIEIERTLIVLLGLEQWAGYGERSGFDPLSYFAGRPLLAYGFLVVRFWGLAVIVPVIEEFLLRGFVMRFVLRADWWHVPFGTLSKAAIAVGTLLPVLTHPVTELLAVLVWFSMITWLMGRTRNIWDCVAAHAVTNFMLGAWVVYSGQWHLM